MQGGGTIAKRRYEIINIDRISVNSDTTFDGAFVNCMVEPRGSHKAIDKIMSIVCLLGHIPL